jgi:hypothetical protein
VGSIREYQLVPQESNPVFSTRDRIEMVQCLAGLHDGASSVRLWMDIFRFPKHLKGVK